MVSRSRMQSFDMEHETRHNLNNSDAIIDRGRATAILSKDPRVKRSAMGAFKTTDRLMHERMAQRPFVAYNSFDTPTFAKYGRPLYDKNEDFRDERGRFVENGRVVEKPPESTKQKELLGQVPEQIQRRRDWMRGSDRTNQVSASWQARQGSGESRKWGESLDKPANAVWGGR
jgi:hypothetical protein